jgi:hypothetical protein
MPLLMMTDILMRGCGCAMRSASRRRVPVVDRTLVRFRSRHCQAERQHQGGAEESRRPVSDHAAQ